MLKKSEIHVDNTKTQFLTQAVVNTIICNEDHSITVSSISSISADLSKDVHSSPFTIRSFHIQKMA